ncbi:cytochrome c1 [Methylobacterium sp. 174MFSha1.1]|uniref:cytochrome c1 n=1 Tax=Methylobacterium sp. 174MFSha1.1 TaxID=1502749 RepID=UPI000B86182E|nr:cytochrome c1 [Methylobacterium sp. 174MFSha1.1]
MIRTRALGTRALLAAAVAAFLSAGAASAEDHGPLPHREKWTFSGMFGTFDQAQLQRGFQVYREVCSNCHSLHYIRFRNLEEEGGPDFSAAQVKALAAEYKVKDGPNDSGDMFERPGRPADKFPSPFPNDQAAAAANGGKAPPDLSLMAKARTFARGGLWFIIDWLPFIGYTEQGPDYIHALLNGYKEEPPKGVTVPEGGHYNEFYPGNVIAMPKPLSDGQVTYAKGANGQPVVPETIDQYSRDVTAFLMWTAEPHLLARKSLGLRAILFLLVLAGLLYYVKKKIWSDVGGETHGLQPELHKTS